ncbi:hypothetical protein KUTeg_013499 [Tegillarca granosa]|uniref:HEAT repeat-containing protein 5B n=1 Tax=Tegillarca granosa TaxID=220873 RepID=A0ABQ9EZ04_TEGGR|nr:hypothetical protein KUTeg_013499 [Tegillarca granosa]
MMQEECTYHCCIFQLQPNSASGSGALEHDSKSLYVRCPPSDPVPGPLPLGVAVIDTSVKLYGFVFPHVAHKHRIQMLQHFNECIKQAKSFRQQAVQMNIFTAVLCALKVWALHALALIADSGGPMFRSYVEPTLSLVLQLLLSVPPSTVDVHQCLGKCLSALITSIGPELQGNSASIATARLYCLVCCAIMQDHPDSLVQAEAIACLQQLHMFAPRHVNLSSLVPHLCLTLASSHLLLRRAAVSCLRQLVTREAGEVSDLALSLASDNKDLNSKPESNITDTGLEGTLFGMMDTETDGKLISEIQDTLISLLQSLATCNLTRWLLLLKDVLSASTDTSSSLQEGQDDDLNDKNDSEDEDDEEEIKVTEADVTHPTVAPRWPTRVFATDCLRKIIAVCEGDETHFDLEKAKELKASTGKGNFLVLHLSELVRMAFIAATSDSNQLRLAGLAALQDIVTKFAAIPEPEFPGHVILEQFQAQVSAALRPAFSADTPSDVTAAACDVCSTWIGSGVARDLNDLRRVHQLLVSSLAKMNAGKSQSHLYNESASTMEKLAVLGAWAEVYIVAVAREKEKNTHPNSIEDDEYGDNCRESLLSLVQPELPTLSQNWFNALKDYAYLTLPAGICMEALSNLTSVLSNHTVDECLKALYALLDSEWPSGQIGQDPVLSRELLNVMHRILLTRDNAQTNLLVLKVVRQILKAAQDKLDTEKKKFTDVQTSVNSSSTDSMDTTDSTVVLGDGGESGEFIPEKSVVFATLEVCLCVISKQIPALNPSAPSTGFQIPTRLTKMSEETCQLIADIILILPDLPNLCSPAGSVAVLPTILHLITGVLREMSAKSAEQKSSVVINACLGALRKLCTSPFLNDENTSDSWIEFLRCALVTIITYAKPTEEKPGMDDITLLGAITIFIVCAPLKVANVKGLISQSVDIFLDTWQSENSEHLDLHTAAPYIKGVASKILQYLCAVSYDKSNVDSQLELILAAVNATEALVAVASTDKKISVLSLLIPILVSFLLEEKSFRMASKASRSLHEDSLQRLMKIGPQYPEQFRVIMASQSDLKSNLEAAIKLSQLTKSSPSAKPSTKLSAGPAKPTITLKTDFSNFSG